MSWSTSVASRRDRLQVLLRRFEKESRIAPHPVIRADEVCFTGLAQALLLPLLVPGHDRVDVGEGYLQRHDAEAVALMEDGRGHERRWRAERRGIRFEIHELDKIGVDRDLGRAEGPTEPRIVVRPGEEIRAELGFLATV